MTMGVLEHLWAGWRASYVQSVGGDERAVAARTSSANIGYDEGGSLFERILTSGLPDEETFIVHRGPTCFAILNLYPYTNGHLLVLPNRAVNSLDGLDQVESSELWATVCAAVSAIKGAYGCDGINMGMNLGRAGGAGIPDHLHMHVLPRWSGDTNFMTAVAGIRVMPETLDETWCKIRDNWPT